MVFHITFIKILFCFVFCKHSHIGNIIIWLPLEDFFLIVQSDTLNDELNLIWNKYNKIKIHIILQGDWELYQNAKMNPFEGLDDFIKFQQNWSANPKIEFISTSTVKESVNKMINFSHSVAKTVH